MMNPILQQAIAWVGQTGITAGAAAIAAFGLFRWLGAKWIEDHFAKELLAAKAAYQRDSDRLKAEVGRLLDRASQLHHREYEALPEAWGLLNKAMGASQDARGSGAIYPHFKTDDPEALAEFIDGEDLADFQKARLKVAPDWYAQYTKMRRDRAIIASRVALTSYSKFIILIGVFIAEPLLEKMRQARDHIADANEKRWAVAEEIAEPGDEAAADDQLRLAGRLVDGIKLAVRATLFETQLPAL